MTTQVETEGLSLPLEIRNIAEVDDAGGEHIECQMTGAFLVDLYKSGLLTLTGNIRPSHSQPKLTGKTRSKVDKWTRELLNNDAIIGNISIRLDPSCSEYDIWLDDETGQTCLTITDGVLDCAVDSLSRIKAILGAADNPLASFNLSTRFQVRIWLLDDSAAKKVATIYNTRGDKVNDSTAKYAYSETKEQELARRLVNGSEHLGQDNVEVLSNSVSASRTSSAPTTPSVGRLRPRGRADRLQPPISKRSRAGLLVRGTHSSRCARNTASCRRQHDKPNGRRQSPPVQLRFMD